MAITFNSNKLDGKQRTIWRGEAKMLPGGFKLLQTFPAGTVLERGLPVYVDMSNLSGAIVKVSKVITGGTTSKPRVGKDHTFVAGDKVQKVGGEAAVTVSSIDTSNADYDVLNLSGAISGLAAGDFITESDGATGQNVTSAPKYLPNAILGEDREILASDLPTIDVAWGALVIKDVAPAIPDAWMADGGLCLKHNHNIVYIRQ